MFTKSHYRNINRNLLLLKIDSPLKGKYDEEQPHQVN